MICCFKRLKTIVKRQVVYNDRISYNYGIIYSGREKYALYVGQSARVSKIKEAEK